ncbi:MAG: hypothetical protein GXP25_19110 [Planctomycetes bacterium]|nr:hypothetical protein [Planctomycetota bacterium]
MNRTLPLLIVFFAAAAGRCAAQVRFDFETGDLQGWKVVEGKFHKLVTDRATFHHGNTPYNKQGQYFLSTLETKKDRPDDRMTGVVESPVFVLRGGAASFLVGGGKHPTTYVALCALDGKELLRASGSNAQKMRKVTWDVNPFAGKKVFLKLVDRYTRGWGHITFDDFQADGELDPKATLARANAREKERRERAQREKLKAVQSGTASLRLAVLDLMGTFRDRYPEGKRFLAKLDALEKKAGSAAPEKTAMLFHELETLKRDATVANPLVRAHPILFVVREQYRPDHHNTATLFQTGEINTQKFRGGGALKTIDFAKGGEVKTLLDVPKGVARDPELHFDGKKIIFSMRKGIEDDYHIYEINTDGTGLKQLTDGPGVSDIDPLYLPDGRIAFSSTREPKYCMCNRHIMCNLFRMNRDGSCIHQIGKNTLFEGQGFLLPDGRILYNRWEYVDRNFGDAQGLWTCNPDGTNHVIYWGNNTKSPGAVIDARAIPGTHRVICVFTSCHDRPWGALAVVDNRLGMDGRAPVIRTWPAGAIGLVKAGWGTRGYQFDVFKRVRPKYEDPYPLSEKYFLCSRMTGKGEETGIYLVDVFGNETLLHAVAPGCFDPMPIAPGPRPAVIPDRIDLARREGYFYVHDVYIGTGMERVQRDAVKRLRVVEAPEKRFWTRPGWQGQGQEAPAMNWDDFGNKRILGSVPIEPDGSAYLALPADKFVFFQLLDEDGMMIQTMRSGTMVRPGETTGCIGCHESRLSTIPNRQKSAFAKAPRRLRPWYGRPRKFNYMAEVQPVFDKYCIRCHDYGKPGAKKLILAGDRTLAFNVSYNELWRKEIINAIGAGPADILPPYTWGSRTSKLVQVLRKGHNDVKLSKEDMDRIVTWIDLNAPFYPFYASAYPGNLFGRSPLTNQQLSRLGKLTGVDFLKRNKKSYQTTEVQVNFTRPELSLCLARLKDTSNPTYKEALSIIRAGKDQLAKRPRVDMPGAGLVGLDRDRQAKYDRLAEAEAQARKKIISQK